MGPQWVPIFYNVIFTQFCQLNARKILKKTISEGGISDGNQALVSIYCTTQLTPPVRSADGCDAFGDDSEDGVCYFVRIYFQLFLPPEKRKLQLIANCSSSS